MALLKGEPLEEVSRVTGQPAPVLKGWKEIFLQGGHLSGWRVCRGKGAGGRSSFSLEAIEVLSETYSISSK